MAPIPQKKVAYYETRPKIEKLKYPGEYEKNTIYKTRDPRCMQPMKRHCKIVQRLILSNSQGTPTLERFLDSMHLPSTEEQQNKALALEITTEEINSLFSYQRKGRGHRWPSIKKSLDPK